MTTTVDIAIRAVVAIFALSCLILAFRLLKDGFKE